LTGIYDDRILGFTAEWVSTNDLCSQVKGDKAGVIPAIKELEDMGYLEMRTNGYLKEYKRIDKAQDSKQFDVMMATFDLNKTIAMGEMIRLDYSITTKNGILTKKGETLLDYVQTELIDRSFMVMSRLRYQQVLKLLPHAVMNKRLQTIQKFVDGVMESLEPLKNEKLILERFQNHTHKLEPFKV
jgi:hypothetical protein